MNGLREKIWLWGQTPGSHHASGFYKLTGENKMTPEEGLAFFGIPNLCRVKMRTDAGRSFVNDLDLCAGAKRLCLSLIGAGDQVNGDDLEDILTVARRDSRVCSAVMDDFVSDARMAVYTPEVLRTLRERLHTGADRKLELWSVMYERDFHRDAEVKSRAVEFDLTTFWTWHGCNLPRLEENLAHMKALTDGGRMMLGVYMYDYGDAKPLPDELMRYQLRFAERKLRSGEIEGIVLCSNCIADIGLSTVDITRDWIAALER